MPSEQSFRVEVNPVEPSVEIDLSLELLEAIRNPHDRKAVPWDNLVSSQERLVALASIIIIELPEENPTVHKEQHNRTVENYLRLAVRTAGDRQTLRTFLLHLLEHLQANMDDSRRAADTLMIWAPAAEIASDYDLKTSLENAAFIINYPDEDQEITATYDALGGDDALSRLSEEYESAYGPDIEQELGLAPGQVQVQCRRKTHYSVWRKVQTGDRPSYNLTDYLGLRLVIHPEHSEDEQKAVEYCYGALGVIHSRHRHVEGRFKDYIASPKANGYRSLHCTYLLEGGANLELQVRTARMHEAAEQASGQSHLAYEAATKFTPGIILKKLVTKPPRIYKWRELAASLEEYGQLFAGKKQFFGGQGNLYELDADASALDCAFSIHSGTALRLMSVMVDGRPRSFDFVPSHGQEVVLGIGSSQSWRESWLSAVSTKRAKTALRKAIMETRLEKNIDVGYRILESGKPPDMEGSVLELLSSLSEAEKDYITFDLYALTVKDFDQFISLIGRQEVRKLGKLYEFLAKKEGRTRREEYIAPYSPVDQESFYLVVGDSDLPLKVAGCCQEDVVPGKSNLQVYASRQGLVAHFPSCVNVGSREASDSCVWASR